VALEEAALPVDVDLVRQERDSSAVCHALLDVLHNGLQEESLQKASDTGKPGKPSEDCAFLGLLKGEAHLKKLSIPSRSSSLRV
jgi:hypothetical protein